MNQRYVWQLKTLLDGVANVDVDATVFGLTADSRQVAPGDLFLACRGLREHGHAYISQALRAGAAAVVYEAPADLGELNARVPVIGVENLRQRLGEIADRFFRHPSQDVAVIGVTGTNGKTTTSHVLAHALSKAESVACGVIGTLGTGLYGDLAPATHTTPESVSLHRLLASFRDAGARHAVMEVSSHAVDQGRISAVNFDTAVYTNLSRDHLDYHGDMETYAAAKRGLFAWPTLRHAVINLDDAYAPSMREAVHGHARVLGYTLNGAKLTTSVDALLSGALIGETPGAMVIGVDSPWGRAELQTPLLGEFNAKNMLAALGVLLSRGMGLGEAIGRLETVRPLPGRMEKFGGDGAKPLVVVDYAHTPDALTNVLKALRSLCVGRLWCVFGCGGDRDKGKRPAMGGIALTYADEVILTNDNPRNEDPNDIVNDILAGCGRSAKVHTIYSRKEAIEAAVRAASASDVVLIAGKGHENYQEISGKRYPFDDREVVRAVLDAGNWP